MEQKEERLLLGSFYILLAASAYALMGVIVKFAKTVSDQQLVFARNAICLLLLLPWILFPKPKPVSTPFFTTHLIRATAGLLNMYCFFYSIRYILLADAMLLNNTMPLFVPFVMWIWKGEKTSPKLIPGLALGFVGILLILRPGLGIFQLAALIALASGFFMSISMAGIRELGKVEPLYRILFFYFAITTCISAVPLFWAWQSQTAFIWLALVGVGFFAALYQFLLTKGYQYGSATKISPMIYFAVILSGFFDWIFWHKVPDAISYIGTALVIIGATYCIRAEAK